MYKTNTKLKSKFKSKSKYIKKKKHFYRQLFSYFNQEWNA